MSVKRIAGIVSSILTGSFIVLILIWAGSFLAEWRFHIVLVFVIAAFVNLGAMSVEWIYEQGEKSGRDACDKDC